MLKKITPFHVMFFTMFCLFALFGKTDCYASVFCSAGVIEKVGPVAISSEGKVVVSLINKSGRAAGSWAPNAWRQFYLHPAIKNQGLATLLTAYSMNKTVWVQIAGNAESASLIETIYINK